MAKLYFKFGAMGSSKTASALMCRFNYMQKNMNVLLIKPKIDTRYKQNEITSRIGLSAPCYAFAVDENLLTFFEKENALAKIDVVIVDECQFCTKKQIDQLRDVAEIVPVLCYGLKTNFKGELFEGSKRLLEISDSISEIKSVCDCGKKAIMNGRFIKNILVYEGEEIDIGGDGKYKGLCSSCYKKEQYKARVYAKILNHLKILQEKENAGEWSSDTAIDNVVLHKPHVIYDEEVQSFIKDFKEFQIKKIDEELASLDNVQDLKKIVMKDKSFDYMLMLISHILKLEKTKPGILKALIEDDTLTKWLKQIKKTIDHME